MYLDTAKHIENVSESQVTLEIKCCYLPNDYCCPDNKISVCSPDSLLTREYSDFGEIPVIWESS